MIRRNAASWTASSSTPDQLPVVIVGDGRVLRNPSNAALADELGLMETIDPNEVFDVAVVGAGPAGLAAAVYAASEGLRTIVIEGMAPGGQAGTSSKIENYLGFPTGISAEALAGRAQVQAQKFGARLLIPRAAASLDCRHPPLSDRYWMTNSRSRRAIVVASGAATASSMSKNYDPVRGSGHPLRGDRHGGEPLRRRECDRGGWR